MCSLKHLTIFLTTSCHEEGKTEQNEYKTRTKKLILVFPPMHIPSIVNLARGYRTLFILKSTEHEILTIYKTKIPTSKDSEASCL